MNNNGGPNAIRGFNYQKAIAALIAIRNYKKNGFRLFIEKEEDLEVSLDNNYIFLQVKSSKLSFSKLTKSSKDEAESILFKLLSKNKPNARYKIVVPKIKFAENDRNKISSSKSNILFFNTNAITDKELLEKLKNHLCKYDMTDTIAKDRLNNTFIYLSDFDSDYEIATNYLLGEMSKNDIIVDEKQGIVSLNEFFNIVDQIGEKNNDINSNKEFTIDHIKTIFKTGKYLNLFDNILQKLKFSIVMQEKIKKEKLQILQKYKFNRNDIKRKISVYNSTILEKNMIKKWFVELSGYKEISKEAKYAILIDILVEKIEEEV